MRLGAKLAAGLFAGVLWGQAALGSCAALSLSQAVDMAWQNNTSLQVTATDEAAAAAVLKKARGASGFALTAAGGFDRTKDSESRTTDTLTAKLTAALPLYTGGRNEAAIASGELGVKAAALLTQRERENIRLAVTTAYYDALEYGKTVKVDQESVDNYQAHLTNVTQLYTAGSKARIDVLRSSVELSNAQQTLIRAQSSYEIGLAKLRNLLNMDRTEPLQLTDDVVYQPFAGTAETCIEQAYRQRKDLTADALALQQKELAVKEAKAGYRPQVSLTAGVSLDDQRQPVRSQSHAFTGGVSVSWDLFDNGVVQGSVDAAKAAREAARLGLQQVREDMDVAVRQEYLNMREAEKRFNSTQAAVNQAEENYTIAREKYRAGEGLMLDIIDAQLALSTAELNYISAQYDYARYKAALENAMGE